MSKDKVRGHVTLAEDTETPKTVSVMDTGHKFHFQIALLSGNIYRIFTHTLKKIKILITYVSGVKCRINFNIILTITPPTVRKHTFKNSFGYLLS